MNKELIDKDNLNEGTEEYQNSVTTSDEHNEQEEGQRVQEDLSSYSKDELLRLLENVKVSEENPSQLNNLLKDIKLNYDNITEAERAEALDKFIQDGGEEADFEYRKDAISQKFDKVYEKKLSRSRLRRRKKKIKILLLKMIF